MTEQTTPQIVARALLAARLLWGVILLSGLGLGIVAAIMVGNQPSPPARVQTAQTLFYVTLVVLVVGLAAGYFTRMQMYKAHWKINHVAPAGYLTGNLVLWSICEAVMVLSMMTVILSGQFNMPAAPGGIALLVHIINFPTGGPMRQAEAMDSLTDP